MKRLVILFAMAFAGVVSADSPRKEGPESPPVYTLQEGDIVFHGNAGQQSEAIRAATGSPYTHCGVVIEKNGQLLVLEAVQPVRVTTVEAFQQRSQPGTFHARRLKAPLGAASLEKAKAWGAKQLGRNYDARFRWEDETLYCSELVWKAFDQAGVRLCEPRRFHDYKLDSPAVKAVIAERYGSADKLPREEPVVAPGDLADSPLLTEVPRVKAKK